MFSMLLYLLASFITLWIGTGISISSIERLSKKIHISSFIASFFILGLVTSLSEISVALFSTINETPGISVGNLLGASTIVTLLVIPIQVMCSKGIVVNTKSDYINFPTAYLVASLPVMLILDGNLSLYDALLMVIAYTYLLFTVSNKETIMNNLEQSISHKPLSILKEILKLLLGSVITIISSKIIVSNMILLAEQLNVSPFIIGLLALSIGTSIPEITILIRSYMHKSRNIALGDYLGSATLNTLILGLLVFANGGSIKITQGTKYNLLVLPLGAGLFLLFSRDKKFERKEALVLVLLYIVFVILEFIL
ncbi:sodium:calcium antiporter [candidate division WWE3 bacterium]|uniref:Sodium:calcium antiporter n=1 Tax=candidate division WWE3 bacterium TaxID=2053526 RepID=A0A7X9HST4_UNCKA|nr:sodium:calcium antiporter [candidate division WWE3 bacterium]